MSGRGQIGRGAARPGRGGVRRYPQPPNSSGADLPEESDEFQRIGDEQHFFQDEESNDFDKKEIQQQKMLLVSPMAQKRSRGRPRRSSVSSQAPINEDFDDILDQQELLESGPLEGPGPSETRPVLGRGSRIRHTPKRLDDFIQIDTVRHVKKVPEVTVPRAPIEEVIETEEQLIPNEEDHSENIDHIENIEHEEEVIEEVIEEPTDEMIQQMTVIRDEEEEEVIEEERGESDGPPPAPPHLLNKANSRGRPANPVPPHRRPLPKDIMPPGTHFLKRVSLMRDPNPAKRKDIRERPMHLEDMSEGPPPLHPPRAPVPQMNHSDHSLPSPLPLSEVPIAVQQVEIKDGIDDDEGPPPIPQMIQQASVAGTSSQETPIKKKEREAGKDLPSEHFPKEKARHVSTRGIHPFIPEKSPLMSYEMRGDEVMMEDIEEQEGGSVAQQRVLTLQGGSFIDDRIGRADLMEDEEMKLMKNMQTQQYIVEENGMNVVYEMDPNDIIESEEQVEMQVGQEGVGQEEQYVLEDMQKQGQLEEEDDDDDLPPQLIPEGVPEDAVGDEERETPEPGKGISGEDDGNFDFNMMHEGESIRLQSPGGRSHEVRVARDEQGNSVFIDENDHIVELITDTGALVEPNNMVEQVGGLEDQEEEVDVKNKQQIQQQIRQEDEGVVPGPGERANMEFMNSCSFLDTNNICCGLCGEIVAYDKLVTEHLPNAHPEYTTPGIELEEVPYNSWLKTRLKQESKMMENGFRHYDEHDGAGFGGTVRLYQRGMKQLRKVSQIRVNVNEMSMTQLETCLKKKLIEKMGRKVPVSLVDRLHARCDICQAVVSLNKKFEVVHLVRHFNAWHPAEHRCSQEWKDQPAVSSSSQKRPLSLHDFAVVSTETDQNNLQCIWCGMMMDRAALGMHFSEVHMQQVIVPNCSLCLQEMVMTARLMEKYGEDFGISLPDEFHLLSSKLNAKYSSEKALDRAIDKYLKKLHKIGLDHDEDDGPEDQEAICTTNSQQSFGRRNRLKRKFVKPCFRQICPTNSVYFEAKSACEWKCRLCGGNVYGAVISAGAIKHYKEFHPAEIEGMQYELVKARLERIGDGSMEFVHPQLVECLICSLTYALHKPFNICRAIRHLRLKHPEVMPETAGKPISGAEISETTNIQAKPTGAKKPPIRFAELITDPIELEKFRKENFDQQFDKVQVVYGIKKNGEPSFILLMENETMDQRTAQEMAERMRTEQEIVDSQNGFDHLVGREEEVQYETVVEEEPSGSGQIEMYHEETKPISIEYPEQIVEGEGEEIEMVEAQEGEFIQTYDANNPDHVLIEENEIMADGSYEMIPEGEYQDIEEDNRTVRYLTEDEIREAQARGEILEFEEEEFVEEGEYAVEQQ
uniref:C2H2-type domain-containing protein n=1 Tax=Caenorhabditis tropicalis TaxID=1561998 RepID=A0A1I7TAA3_9PELO